MEKFTFFWRSESAFSQWYPSSFTVDGITYNCAEQYMMRQKAALFQDWEMARKILSTRQPSEQKKLGRRVRNFDEQVWRQHRFEIVKAASIAKFTQNIELKKQLLETSGTTLVEASPRDRIWGIGLPAESAEAQRRETWRGMNLLGQALTEVREEIRKGSKKEIESNDAEKEGSGEKTVK